MGKSVSKYHPVTSDETIDEKKTGDGSGRIHHRIEPPSDREKVKLCGQKKLKHDSHPEHGNGNARDREESGTMIDPSISVNGRENPKQDPKDDGEANGNKDQFEGGRQKEFDIFPDLMSRSDRPAEIPFQQTFHIGHVLNNERLI
jgi:hypothetical protein